MGTRKSRLPIPAGVEHALDSALDKALSIQRPVVQAYLNRVRAKHPGDSPADVIDQLERRYRASVIGLGAASGSAAAVPGIGTVTSVAAGAAEITAFVSATAMYVLALAELHGIPVSDPDVRRAMVLAVLVGEGDALAIESLAGGAGEGTKHWAQVIGRRGTKNDAGGLNGRLGRLLLTRFGARQGALLVGRAVPLGIGAGIGAVGNAALARAAIKAARRAFGPPPQQFPPRVIDVATPSHGPPVSEPPPG
ncbi:MAG: hypothetical protein M3070_03290 [Actinomycetota bacterium]|nr:hypothetical protein [Actinomycetota bacterium]